MEFEYDPQKSVRNLAKHGIDFEEAQELWEGTYIKASANDGASTYALVGMARGIHWTAIATDREGRVRMISVRRSTDRERDFYEQRKDHN